jgi:polyribonucleotide nucleotidyltransferase
LTGARTTYALGRDFRFFGKLGAWREAGSTPANALLVQGAITLVLVLVSGFTPDGFSAMVAYTSPVFWTFFLLTALTLFVFRRQNPEASSFRVPLVIRDPRPEADASRGRHVSAFTEAIDVSPTIIDWIGGEVPRSMDGESLAAKVKEAFAAPEGEEPKRAPEQVASTFKELQAKVVRWNILDTGARIDGRDLETVRPIVAEVGVLPRTHGSAVFTRGETQSVVVATLGTGEDEQFVDALTGTYKETFLLHYNFPPFSVGETGRIGSPGRREVGHGKLAWRAIHPMLPSAEQFPYTLRVVSEITESNGSSSMATVCGTSLALMDAGVPIAKPVAGIAMGLIKEGDRFAVLSDILGDEDHLGDMDFKVAGTDTGITSLQMDIKIAGITEEIMKIALDQAKGGRSHILGEMSKALAESRGELGEFAPRIEVMNIPTDKIRDVIGSGGKIIREIVEKTGAKINIEDDGTVKIASSNAKEIEAAKKWIHTIVAEPEVGEIYEGTVVKTADFGAFVNFFGPKDGLVHISQLAPERVQKTTDVVKEGDKVFVKLMGFDERGKVRLSMKVVDQTTGKEIAREKKEESEEVDS